MENPLITLLNDLGELLTSIDKLRQKVGDLNPGTDDMKAAKIKAGLHGAKLFDAIVDYQRAVLNGPFRNAEHPAVKAKIGEEIGA